MIDPIYDIKIDKNDYGYFISIWKNRKIEKDLEVINFLEEDSKKYFKNLMEYNAVFVKLNNLYEGKLEESKYEEMYFKDKNSCINCIKKYIIPLLIKIQT